MSMSLVVSNLGYRAGAQIATTNTDGEVEHSNVRPESAASLTLRELGDMERCGSAEIVAAADTTVLLSVTGGTNGRAVEVNVERKHPVAKVLERGQCDLFQIGPGDKIRLSIARVAPTPYDKL